MTILTDLIFMAVDAWFNEYLVDDTDNTLFFSNIEDIDKFLNKVNYNFDDLRKFDNFKGGFCVTDDNRIVATVIMYLLTEEGLATITKDFHITY